MMSNVYMKLSFRIHDILSNFKHDVLFMTDFKYAYSIIFLMKKCSHYFAFIISAINQIQFTRMQQEFMKAEFIFTENVYKIFECISTSNSEFFLLHAFDSQKNALLIFYINDFFENFSNFESLFIFLRNHFFFKIEWIKFKFSFKKLQLFMNFMKILNVTHSVKNHVHIISSKAKKIAK